ncbi:MAG: FRG domain-containing protein [Octadecabacter sp.]|nr:FRG domain-containing protein [Octadecabacter sp.]
MARLFNYISIGNRDLLVDENPMLSLSIGRVFEYTPKEVSDALTELEHGSISYLEKLPAFLCSEVDYVDGSPTMLVKFGRATNIAATEKQVSADFDTILDLGEVLFDTVGEINDVFGTDKFQIHRTHWAVRKGGAGEVLARLSKSKAHFEDGVADALKAQTNLAQLNTQEYTLPRKKKTGVTANSVESFLEMLFTHSPVGSTETFYRGHEDANFELTPSLLRKWPDGGWQFLEKEERLNKELLIAHYNEFQDDQYCFDRLVRMQHYGLPTRLLDISGNPLVALFFACFGAKELRDVEGEVIIFRVLSDSVKYFDSDTVSCLSNLSNLTFEQKNEIDLLKDRDDFNKTEVVKKLLHHIKSEKGYFEGRIEPDHIKSIICAKAKQTNSRIKSQSGAFLLFGHEATLAESGQANITVERIRIRDKQKILKQLNSININATTVYPSIDRTTNHLRERYRRAEEP